MRMTNAAFAIAPLATAVAVSLLGPADALARSPLTQRLLHANEIAGYTPVRSTVKTLGLEALSSVTGRTPKQLDRAGFRAGAVENLHGPNAVPRGFVSQSSLIRFRTDQDARAFLATVAKGHTRTPPGVERTAFTLPAVPSARGTRLVQERLHQRVVEYDVMFVAGPFAYEVSIFTSTGAPSQADLVSAVTNYYHRLATVG
jgi:hypothetical protein